MTRRGDHQFKISHSDSITNNCFCEKLIHDVSQCVQSVLLAPISNFLTFFTRITSKLRVLSVKAQKGVNKIITYLSERLLTWSRGCDTLKNIKYITTLIYLITCHSEITIF